MQQAPIQQADSEQPIDTSTNSTTCAAGQSLEGTSYRLNSLLGMGSMGEVYLGEHERLRRPAVIKIIRGHYARDPKIVGRMIREARIVANLQHKALVHVYDLGTSADGRTYIAMEHLNGDILRLLLHHRGALPADEACLLMIQALEGLAAAHGVGVIHRDIKPENLFVTSLGQLKVLDFGVAKMPDSGTSGAYTAAGMVVGTPRYMAPEQARGYPLSFATDLYAIGCVLFECLTGTAVFEATNTQEYLRKHLFESPPTLAMRTGRKFDEELEAIVAQALHKDPNERFTNAQAMAEALQHVTRRLVSLKRYVPMGTVIKANIGKDAYLTKQNLGFLKTTLRANFDAMTVSSQLGATLTSAEQAQTSALAYQATNLASTDHTELVQSAWLIHEYPASEAVHPQEQTGDPTHITLIHKKAAQVSILSRITSSHQKLKRIKTISLGILVLLSSGILFSHASYTSFKQPTTKYSYDTSTFKSFLSSHWEPFYNESLSQVSVFRNFNSMFYDTPDQVPSLLLFSNLELSTELENQKNIPYTEQKSNRQNLPESQLFFHTTSIHSVEQNQSVASSSTTSVRREPTPKLAKKRRTTTWLRE